MAYVPVDTNLEEQKKATTTAGASTGPTPLTEGSVSVSGGIDDNMSAPTSGTPQRSGSDANFQRYASLLEPQGAELAQDFTQGISDRNVSRLGGQLQTAQENFSRDRLANTRQFDQGTVDKAIRDARSSNPLVQQRRTDYKGPQRLQETGINTALQKAQADYDNLQTARGRASMLTSTEGITPGMAALDSFLMQGNRDVFNSADFNQRGQKQAGEAYRQSEAEAANALAANRDVADRTEAGLYGGTRDYLAQLQGEQATADAALSRLISGQGIQAGDYAETGLNKEQYGNLVEALKSGNARKSEAAFYPDNKEMRAQGLRRPRQDAFVHPGDPAGDYGILAATQKGWYSGPGQARKNVAGEDAWLGSDTNLRNRLGGGTPMSAQDLIEQYSQQRFGKKLSTSELNQILRKNPQLRTIQGVINKLINPAASQQVNTGWQRLDKGTQGMYPYLSRAGVTQGEYNRLDALERLSRRDVGDIDVTGRGTNYNESLYDIQQYGNKRDRELQGLLGQNKSVITDLLAQAAKDRNSGVVNFGDYDVKSKQGHGKVGEISRYPRDPLYDQYIPDTSENGDWGAGDLNNTGQFVMGRRPTAAKGGQLGRAYDPGGVTRAGRDRKLRNKQNQQQDAPWWSR